MKKKFLAVMAAAAMTVSLLAGCGAKPAETAAAETAAEAAETEASGD